MTDETTQENVTFDIIAELKNTLTIIDYAAEQGAFKGWQVINQVLAVRGRVSAFIELFEEAAKQKAAEEVAATGNAFPAEVAPEPTPAPEAVITPTPEPAVNEAPVPTMEPEAPVAAEPSVSAEPAPAVIEAPAAAQPEPTVAVEQAPVVDPVVATVTSEPTVAVEPQPPVVEAPGVAQPEPTLTVAHIPDGSSPIVAADTGFIQPEPYVAPVEVPVAAPAENTGIVPPSILVDVAPVVTPAPGADPVIELPPVTSGAPQFDQQLLDELRSKDAADLLGHEIEALQTLQAAANEANTNPPA
jgi:hypothetical protein